MTLSQLQKQARENWRKHLYHNPDEFNEDWGTFHEWLDSLILQAVTEAYKADEIEESNWCGEIEATGTCGHDHSFDMIRNECRSTQKSKQRAFLGEGEV